jgi:hypothetical protein
MSATASDISGAYINIVCVMPVDTIPKEHDVNDELPNKKNEIGFYVFRQKQSLLSWLQSDVHLQEAIKKLGKSSARKLRSGPSRRRGHRTGTQEMLKY